jgi:hypothetical protein
MDSKRIFKLSPWKINTVTLSDLERPLAYSEYAACQGLLCVCVHRDNYACVFNKFERGIPIRTCHTFHSDRDLRIRNVLVVTNFGRS